MATTLDEFLNEMNALAERNESTGDAHVGADWLLGELLLWIVEEKPAYGDELSSKVAAIKEQYDQVGKWYE